MRFGIHTRPQFLDMEEFERVWSTIDAGGFYWASVSDRAYANPDPDRKELCFEATTAWANLAARTTKVRVGCLMLNALVRNPVHIARAATTIDHISKGRAELGLGAGYVEHDFKDIGLPFPKVKVRLDALEERLVAIRALIGGEVVTTAGEHIYLQDAKCTPPPYTEPIRIWVGGGGLKRTPQIVARHADGAGWAFASTQFVAAQNAAVDAECEGIGRDPTQITRSVNLGCYIGADEKAAARQRKLFDKFEVRKEGALLGTKNQVIEIIEAYQAVGIDQINLTFRQQIDWEALEYFIEEIIPIYAR